MFLNFLLGHLFLILSNYDYICTSLNVIMLMHAVKNKLTNLKTSSRLYRHMCLFTDNRKCTFYYIRVRVTVVCVSILNVE